MVSEPASIFLSAPDGLRLHVRRYGRPSSQALPVLCLPGLARTAADFETLAHALSADPKHPRPVFALDYRGRGQSDYDRDVSHYSFQTVLDDIGPVIEPQGLMRIKGYVGKLPQPRNFEEGAEILRRLFSGQFPKLGHDDWLAASKRTFKQADDALVPTYDVRLAETLAGFEPEQHLPALWKEFDALAQRPLMVIRGANSDLLSPLTVTAMRARRAEMDAIEVPDQGHAPLLAEPDIIGRISAFAAGCDAAH